MKKSVYTKFKENIWINLLFFLIITGCYEIAYSQPSCDPDLLPAGRGDIAYGPRGGNRCEGFYRSRVVAPTIDVVSVIKGSFKFEWNSDEVIELLSPVIRKKAINVRAVGVPVRTYYRMDAQIGPGQTLTWPVRDVIYPQRVYPDRIGVFGWITEKKMYVPIAKSGATGEDIYLYLRTSVDVNSLKWRVSDIINDSNSQPSEWKNTDRDSYRAGQPIPITLPRGNGEAFYIEIAARERTRAEWLKHDFRVVLKEKE